MTQNTSLNMRRHWKCVFFLSFIYLFLTFWILVLSSCCFPDWTSVSVPFRAVTLSSSSHLWSSRSPMGTDSPTAQGCQMRWDNTTWTEPVLFCAWVWMWASSCAAAPSSELASGWQRAHQGAFSLGPEAVCSGAEAARSSRPRHRAARQRPHRRVGHRPDVWSHRRFGVFLPSASFILPLRDSFLSLLLRTVVLRANTEDVKPVSGVPGPKGSERRRH